MFKSKCAASTTAQPRLNATPGIALCSADPSRSNRLFCALKYQPAAPLKGESSGAGQVVLLVVRGGKGELAFYFCPDLWRLASGAEFLYLKDFVLDLPRRAKRYPDLLFQQLCSMSVGPLVTHMVGVNGVDDLELISTCAQLVNLDFVLGTTGTVQ